MYYFDNKKKLHFVVSAKEVPDSYKSKIKPFSHNICICIYGYKNYETNKIHFQIFIIDSLTKSKSQDCYMEKIIPELIVEINEHINNNNEQFVWNTPILFNNNLFNSGDKASEYGNNGYCVLISLFFVDVLHRNILMHDTIHLFTTQPSVVFIERYIANALNFLFQILHSDNSMWWIFLCNYARNVLQDVLFIDKEKSLQYYKEHVFKIPETQTTGQPFYIKNLESICKDPYYNRNGKDFKMNLIFRRFALSRKYLLFTIGFNINTTKCKGLLNLPQTQNNFDFFCPINYIFDKAAIVPDTDSLTFLHINKPNSFLTIDNDISKSKRVSYDDFTQNDFSKVQVMFLYLDEYLDRLIDNANELIYNNDLDPLNFLNNKTKELLQEIREQEAAYISTELHEKMTLLAMPPDEKIRVQ